VTDISPDVDWSPADNPYAIAVSQATWWFSAVRLSAGRLHNSKDLRALPVSSTQIDARVLVIALVQLLRAERLEQSALRAKGVSRVVRRELTRARSNFLEVLPNLVDMRDALTHFDEWALGRGRGPQKAALDAGWNQRDVAAYYWSFGYHPGESAIRFGPFCLDVPKAVDAARALHQAIYEASGEVDRMRSEGIPAEGLPQVTPPRALPAEGASSTSGLGQPATKPLCEDD
jgi:hypothetical protein